MKAKSLVSASIAAFIIVAAGTASAFADGKPTPSPSGTKAQTIWQGRGTGRSADAQFSDALGGGRINLFQNGDSTFLFYEIWGNDPESRVCTFIVDQFGNTIEVCVFTRFRYEYGWGKIPGNDLKFTATNAHLRTITGANFSTTRCVTDSSTSNVVTTCTNGIPVTFDLTWQSDNFSTHTIVGAHQQAFASFAFTSQGTSVARSAYVTGNANSRTLFNAPGRLGNTKGKDVATVVTP